MTQATSLETTNTPTQLLSDKQYSWLKTIAQVILPGLITLYLALAQAWGIPWGEQVGATLGALNLFIGGLVAYAKKIHEVSGAAYDGTLALEDSEDGTTLRLKSVDSVALTTKDSVTFKVVNR